MDLRKFNSLVEEMLESIETPLGESVLWNKRGKAADRFFETSTLGGYEVEDADGWEWIDSDDNNEISRTIYVLPDDKRGPTVSLKLSIHFKPGTDKIEGAFIDGQLIETKDIHETGEADQDYDKELYDAIVKALRMKGYQAKHTELDKYQGVYLDISKGGKSIDTIWTVDGYEQGKTETPKGKYKKATLVGPEDDVYSATPGDYFQLSKNHVFKDLDLVLVKHDGTSETISNPKLSDLPSDADVDSYVHFIGKPSFVLVMSGEKGGEEKQFEVTVDPKGKADISELVAYLKTVEKE